MTNEPDSREVGSNAGLGAGAEAHGTVTADFPIIRLGLGLVEIGNARYEGLPALWFGRGGRGLYAPVMELNRPANDGETLVLFTFADIRGLDVLEAAIARLRTAMETPNA